MAAAPRARWPPHRADRPDRFLYLGDVYPNGTAAEFRRNYAPIYGALKDHRADDRQPRVGQPQQRLPPYWRRAKGRAQRHWYSFRLGGWELINLNSQPPHGPSAQLRWLRSRLNASPGTCRLAFFHLPRFGAGELHGDAPAMAPLWNALRGHARLVLDGHEHTSSAFAAATASPSTWPAGRRDPLSPGPRFPPGLGPRRHDAALRIVLEPGTARLEFRSASGRLLDSSRATCRR